MGKNQFVGIENILDIFDQNRLWYYIPGFNGYEVSNDGYLRSMKHYRRYPYGILIKPVQTEKYAKSCDPLYEISDDNNRRQRIRLSQLMYLAAANQYSIYGYPRCTIITNTSSRNKFVKNQDGVYCKVYNGRKAGGGKNSYSIPPIDNTARYAHFTIVQKGTEHPLMEYKGSDVRVPLKSLNNTEYYGRQDCRVFSDFDIAEPINIDKEGEYD